MILVWVPIYRPQEIPVSFSWKGDYILRSSETVLGLNDEFHIRPLAISQNPAIEVVCEETITFFLLFLHVCQFLFQERSPVVTDASGHVRLHHLLN